MGWVTNNLFDNHTFGTDLLHKICPYQKYKMNLNAGESDFNCQQFP